jgi:predicted nucleotidyltransferase
MDERQDPADVARRIVAARYPSALCAIVGGSLWRGDGTSSSDIDLVVIDETGDAPFRESFIIEGWPVEAFVHTRQSIEQFFVDDAARERPSLPTMVAEGEVVVSRDGVADHVRQRAIEILHAGPAAPTAAELEDRRYGLTDLLDDFIGCETRDEGILLAAMLAETAANLLLTVNGAWNGSHKWTPRALGRFHPELRSELAAALESYARQDHKAPMVAFAEGALDAAGGRVFEGYRRVAPRL